MCFKRLQNENITLKYFNLTFFFRKITSYKTFNLKNLEMGFKDIKKNLFPLVWKSESCVRTFHLILTLQKKLLKSTNLHENRLQHIYFL